MSLMKKKNTYSRHQPPSFLATVQKVPDTAGASLWGGRGSSGYPKGQRRSLLTSVAANNPREDWDGVNVSGPPPQSWKKTCHEVGRGKWEVAIGSGGGMGSGWQWVPDWGTSGDFWGGRAMHHVSCYQPLFPHLIVNAWIMHGGWDWRKGGEIEGWGNLNLKGALPQWESLPMNNHTDEPEKEWWRKRGAMMTVWRRKTNMIQKQNEEKPGSSNSSSMPLIKCFSITQLMFCCCFHLFIHLSII